MTITITADKEIKVLHIEFAEEVTSAKVVTKPVESPKLGSYNEENSKPYDRLGAVKSVTGPTEPIADTTPLIVPSTDGRESLISDTMHEQF